MNGLKEFSFQLFIFIYHFCLQFFYVDKEASEGFSVSQGNSGEYNSQYHFEMMDELNFLLILSSLFDGMEALGDSSIRMDPSR